jgi:hypothetical protein
MRATFVLAALGLAILGWRALAPAVPPAAPAPGAASLPAAGAVAAQPLRPVPAAGRGAQQATAAAGSSSKPTDAGVATEVEAAVREARRSGKGEQEVHRLRATQLTAAQVEELARMEAAEAAWRQRLEALNAACAANLGCDDARASFTPAELRRVAAYAAPALRQ